MHAERLVPVLTLGGLVAMMLSMGLKVSWHEVLTSTRSLRLMFLGIVANFALIPALTLGLLALFAPDPLVSAGFLILAACPGAPVGPLFAAIAGGDVPFALGQMVILASLSVGLSPVLLSLMLSRVSLTDDLQFELLPIVRSLLLAQLLPLAIGLAVHRQWPKFAAQSAARLGQFANLLLLTVIVLILIGEHRSLEAIRMRGWFGMLLLLGATLAVGWMCGGPDRTTRKTLALTTAARNAALALVIVSNNFAGTPAVTAVVGYSLFSILGSLGCAVVFGVFSRQNA